MLPQPGEIHKTEIDKADFLLLAELEHILRGHAIPPKSRRYSMSIRIRMSRARPPPARLRQLTDI
jgi:hypothetical protein